MRTSTRAAMRMEIRWLLASAMLVVLAISLAADPQPVKPAESTGAAAGGQARDGNGKKAAHATPAEANRAGKLFAQHCAACHGETGDGQGPAAKFLEPKPRNLRDSRYRMISSATTPAASLPDVLAVLKRGMPGSSMPSWAHLPEVDRLLLVGQVLQFRKDGARDKAIAAIKEEGDDVTEQAINDYVAKLPINPGPPLQVADLGKPTRPQFARQIARGKEVFAKACASCHGKTGKGDGVEKMLTTEGYLQRPRDLTLGIYKGDDDPVSVYRRIRLGLPGSSMPSNNVLTHEEIADVTHFVLSLSDEPTRQSYVARRETIVAKKTDAIPADLNAPVWSEAQAKRLVVFPLWWRDFADPNLQAQAAYDGEQVAFRLTWKDATKNDSPIRTEDFEDLASLQIFKGDSEPFLGMGAKDGVLELWLWRASWGHAPLSERGILDDYPFDRAIYKELTKAHPKGLPDFLTARAAGNLHADAGRTLSGLSLEAKGFGTLTLRPRASQLVTTTAAWRDGVWTVVLRRPLAVNADAGLTIKPGDHLSAAFAIWDGQARDRNGQKMVSIWHDLRLEP